jgi:Ca-activated chloride channel homolog
MRAANFSRSALGFLPCFLLCSLNLLSPAFAGEQNQQPANPPASAIRVSVDRVNVGVIVTDSHGKFIGGLPRDDFHIFDDGVEQPITDFAPIDAPAQVLMLVEAGPSVYFLEAGHMNAASALLQGLSSGDRVAVVKYDTTPQPLLDFTADKNAVQIALSKVRYYIGFGNLNLSRSLATVLDWLAKVQGKKTIVLLSTGFDTSEPDESSNLLSRLQTADVRILALSLGGELRKPAPKMKGKNQQPPEKTAITEQGFAEADHFLSTLAETTGGRVYFPNSTKDFATVYAEIAQLVRHEYSLAFAPPANDGKSHALEVRVSPPVNAALNDSTPTYRVDQRRAYLASAP